MLKIYREYLSIKNLFLSPNSVIHYFFSGKEFEHLIDSHGPEHVTGLMQKVISALEHLERFAAEADSEETTIESLRATIMHLEMGEVKKNEEKHRQAKVLKRERDNIKRGLSYALYEELLEKSSDVWVQNFGSSPIP